MRLPQDPTERVPAPEKAPAFSGRSGYPPDLIERPHWYACHTRSRAEKKVDQLMARSGVESYLPLIIETRHWADREKRVAFPMFPGYVFARFTLLDTNRVLATPGVSSIAQPNGYPTPVREDEMESVRRLVEGANETGVVPLPVDFLQPGEPVEVTDGPFRGMKGRLLEVRGRCRVALTIASIRQALAVDITRSLVRRVHTLSPSLRPPDSEVRSRLRHAHGPRA